MGMSSWHALGRCRVTQVILGFRKSLALRSGRVNRPQKSLLAQKLLLTPVARMVLALELAQVFRDFTDLVKSRHT